MTPEFGAASQLKRSTCSTTPTWSPSTSSTARAPRRARCADEEAIQRNHERFSERPEDMPVFGTMAARFNDDGVTALYHHVPRLRARMGDAGQRQVAGRR